MNNEYSKAPKGLSRFRLLATAIAVLGFVMPAHAQDTSSDAQAQDEDASRRARAAHESTVDPDEIVVVGTSLRGGNAIGPVTVITAEDIERSGALTVREVLRTLPQNAGAGVNEVSVEFQRTGGATGGQDAYGTSPNLRGLGSKSTLVLVNGHRLSLAGYNQTADVSQIPIAAIERVEVLTDGASAVYGADALAGVVNLVLRDAFTGGEINASLGGADGGYQQQLYSATVGNNWSVDGGRGSVIVGYEFFDQQPLLRSDRPDLSPATADLTLVPEQQRNSIFFHGAQALGADLQGRITGFVTERNGSSFQNFGSDFITNFDTLQWTTQVALEKDWGNNWSSNVALIASQDDATIDFFFAGPLAGDERIGRSLAVEAASTGEVPFWAGRTLDLAFGGEYRRESLLVKSPSSRLDRSRELRSAFVEARTTIFGDVSRGEGYAELSLAARWDEYSDFGSATSPKVSLLWRPLESLRLSGTWGSGYRAPTLYDLYAGAATSIFGVGTWPDSTSLSGANPAAVVRLTGSNDALQPEESDSWSFTVDWSPSVLPAFRSRATFYSIDISNAIQAPRISNSTALSDSIVAPIVVRLPSQAEVLAAQALTSLTQNFSGQPFDPSNIWAIIDLRTANLASAQVSGVDLDVSYEHSIGPGTATFSANASYLDQLTNRFLPNVPEQSLVDTIGNPTRWRVRASAGYTWGPIDTLLTFNYVNSYSNDLSAISPRAVESWLTTDLRIGFDGGALDTPGILDGVRAAIVVRNIADEAPPRVLGTGAALNTAIGYDPANADPVGRYVTLRISKEF